MNPQAKPGDLFVTNLLVDEFDQYVGCWITAVDEPKKVLGAAWYTSEDPPKKDYPREGGWHVARYFARSLLHAMTLCRKFTRPDWVVIAPAVLEALWFSGHTPDVMKFTLEPGESITA